MMTLMLIACDRFFGIVYAMKAHIIERKALPSILVVWIVSIATGVPMLIRKKMFERPWRDMTERWCDDEWEKTENGVRVFDRRSRVAYYTSVTFLLYFIPLIVMVCAYAGVIRTLWRSQAPGERLSKDVNIQTKVKRKVMTLLIKLRAL